MRTGRDAQKAGRPAGIFRLFYISGELSFLQTADAVDLLQFFVSESGVVQCL